MKRQYSIILLICTLLICLPWFAFHEANPATNRLEAVQSFLRAGMDQFQTSINELQQAAIQLDQQAVSIERLQQAHLQCRLAFKKIEFLLEYYQHEAIDNFINGAPLPGLEPKVADINILEPEGLQVLDELAFSENPFAEKATILEMVDRLNFNFSLIQEYQENVRMYDRHIFEAIRFELIRVFTLGLTGFDTPGSANAIPEAIASFESMHQVFKQYAPFMDHEMADEILPVFQEGIQALKANPSFEDFDRLAFLKKYINPLFQSIYEAQRLMGVEMIYEVDKTTQAINYDATNIFAEDFLNPGYFTQVAKVDLTPERIALGRLLFFDPILSENNQRACASCHQPAKAFTDGRAKSIAFDFNGNIERNAPTIINAAYNHRWFHDMRLEQLEKQIEHVVFNQKEFNTDFEEIMQKLRGSQTYQELFKKAYGTQVRTPISQYTISNAILAYVSSLRGFNSPVDQYILGTRNELDEAAKRGFNLFMGKAACGSCHFAPTFGGVVPPYFAESESEVLGVPTKADTINLVLDPDLGRYGNRRPMEHVDFYKHSFKTVTVRNVALTAPYMHNGAYPDLESVVDFYNRGGGAGMGIDLPHQTLPFSELNLSKQEQSDLVVFMEHLTDTLGMIQIPTHLPKIQTHPALNNRKVGGVY